MSFTSCYPIYYTELVPVFILGAFSDWHLKKMQCPLLCKEFIIDAWQIYYARIKGADAILLIAAVLPDLDIKYMAKICKLLGLTALVEVLILHFIDYCNWISFSVVSTQKCVRCHVLFWLYSSIAVWCYCSEKINAEHD